MAGHEPVSQRLGHVVAVWRDMTVVWGGYHCKYTVSEADAEFYWYTDAILYFPPIISLILQGSGRRPLPRGRRLVGEELPRGSAPRDVRCRGRSRGRRPLRRLRDGQRQQRKVNLFKLLSFI